MAVHCSAFYLPWFSFKMTVILNTHAIIEMYMQIAVWTAHSKILFFHWIWSVDHLIRIMLSSGCPWVWRNFSTLYEMVCLPDVYSNSFVIRLFLTTFSSGWYFCAIKMGVECVRTLVFERAEMIILCDVVAITITTTPSMISAQKNVQIWNKLSRWVWGLIA